MCIGARRLEGGKDTEWRGGQRVERTTVGHTSKQSSSTEKEKVARRWMRATEARQGLTRRTSMACKPSDTRADTTKVKSKQDINKKGTPC